MTTTATQKFVNSEEANTWIRQFASKDQADAVSLMQAIVLVSRDEFAERLRQLVRRYSEQWSGPIGLYAERELPRRFGRPLRLFRETDAKIRRAEGAGP